MPDLFIVQQQPEVSDLSDEILCASDFWDAVEETVAVFLWGC